ncbi:uncharacterized protein LOC128209070 [Mya arenaria]|uniref:uncharacterized protein LOC128209070 n=1 Tax=Mya arenaria TaxID=6604 RepID=UPI0022E07FCC|nr:uncharacterized protein LOC128209070 [Mya arenaria]
MASKDAQPSSLESASEFENDFDCDICLYKDNKKIEAKFCCVDCSKCYCDICVIYHNGMLNKHTVLDRSDVNKWVSQANAFARCGLHPRNVVEMVCEIHGELCCNVCVTFNHKMCRSLRQVKDLAKGIHEMADFKQLPANVSKLTSNINQVIQDMKKKQQSVKESGKSMLKEINALRSALNQLLDELEKRTVIQMKSGLADLDDTLQKDVDSCTRIHDQINDFLDNIRSNDKGSEPNSYICYRKCQDKMTEANSLLHKMSNKAEMSVSFNPDNRAKQLLSDLMTLGEIQTIERQKVFTVKTKHTYSVRQKTNDKTCDITGISELPGGDIILTDSSNSQIKLLSSQFDVIANLEVPKYPQDICHTTGDELAVAVNCDIDKRYEVHFLTVSTGKIKKIRKFTVDHSCFSIRQHQGQLYIGSRTALYLYTTVGQLITTVYENTSGYITVNRFALSRDGSKIYVPASSNQKLITIDRRGNILATLDDPDFVWPCGVHVSESGHVFVCSYDSNTVSQVDLEGRKKLATLVREGRPESIWYSTHTSRLIVAGSQDDIVVTELQ